MKRTEKIRGIIVLMISTGVLLLLFSMETSGNPGGPGSGNREYNCGGSCHGIQSTSTISMGASDLNLEAGQTVVVTVTVDGAEASNSPMGVFLRKSLITSSSQPSVDGWDIVTDPGGTSNYNFYQKNNVTLGDTLTWELKGPTKAGTYYLFASEHHGNGARYRQDNTVGLKFVVKDITPPTAMAGLDLQGPRGTVAEFNGSLSADNVGVANWTWTLNYDGKVRVLFGKIASFTFLIKGDYLITLRVTDAAGQAGTDTMWVNITKGFEPNDSGATGDEKYNVMLSTFVVSVVIVIIVTIIIQVILKKRRYRKIKSEESIEKTNNTKKKKSMMKCPECMSDLKPENLERHLKRVHSR